MPTASAETTYTVTNPVGQRVRVNRTASGSFVGEWTSSPYRPGLPASRERVISDVSIIRADFYGTGERDYAEGCFRVETEGGGTGPAFGHWSDGSPNAVANWKRRISDLDKEG